MMDEAIAWHIGLAEAGADEWHRFVAWLEADPAHQDAYDTLALADADAGEALAHTPAPLRAPARPSRPILGRWARPAGVGGGLVAAAAAAWLMFVPAAAPGAEFYSIVTKAGEHRTVMLADGSRVVLNGDTALRLDRRDPRAATLERGEALFDVVHHADRPFEVAVSGVTLRDVGTRFNVRRAAGATDVAVAEGEVLFQPGAQAVSLTSGMALRLKDGDDRAVLRRVQASSVAGWNTGRLDYREASLADVAADVTRSTGVPVRIAGGFAGQPFTGTLRIDRSSDQVVRALADLVGGRARRDGPGWLIAPISQGAF